LLRAVREIQRLAPDGFIQVVRTARREEGDFEDVGATADSTDLSRRLVKGLPRPATPDDYYWTIIE